MRVLMLSLDRGFWGNAASGDVIKRHQKYADLAGTLDVIVFARAGYEKKEFSTNFRVFPTRSGKLSHFKKAAQIAAELERENSYDLLVTQEFAAPAGEKIKKLLNLPWVVNVHSMFFSRAWLGFMPWKWYLLWRIKKAIRLADGFRVNNEAIKDQLKQWGVVKPILVQPTPIDLQMFQNLEKLHNPVPVILYVGRLSAEKNIPMLIRAFLGVIASAPTLVGGGSNPMGSPRSAEGRSRDDKSVELQIVGSGPETEKLEAMAGGDKRIRFLGAKPYEELPGIYAKADIFVLPSDTESFGKVLIEAGAAGCAIIATRTTGAMSIFGDSAAALLVRVGDRKELSEAIAKLLGDVKLRKMLGERARQLAAKYDAESATIKTVDFWREIAKR